VPTTTAAYRRTARLKREIFRPQFPLQFHGPALRVSIPPAPASVSRCLTCNNTGWRYVQVNGEQRVTRCECWLRRRRQLADPAVDRKAAAAGERE